MDKFNKLDVNGGFPSGMVVAELKPLVMVRVMWNDAPDERVLVIDVDKHAHNYKGERSFKAIDKKGIVRSIVHTQIVQTEPGGTWLVANALQGDTIALPADRMPGQATPIND